MKKIKKLCKKMLTLGKSYNIIVNALREDRKRSKEYRGVAQLG